MRRRPLLAPLLLAAGCATRADHVPPLIEQQILTVAPARVETVAFEEVGLPKPETPTDLAGLWHLALAHKPELREAAAEVEMARGRLVQAGLYPNPKFGYHGETMGGQLQAKGTQSADVTQEVVTSGKRRLELAAAGRGLDAATTALLGRKLEALTRLRRTWYDYQALIVARQVQREVVAALEKSVEIARQRVEVAKDRPRTDLLRLQALLEQARAGLARSEVNVAASWKLAAAETGVNDLPPPPNALAPAVPLWDSDAIIQRVLSVNTDLSLAAIEADQARLEYERARAEVVPNVTLGVGYTRDYLEQTAGVNVSLETPIPLWDRKQGLIHEKRARWAQAQAAERSTALRLRRDSDEAFGRYEGARIQAERLATQVLPKLEETLELVRAGYQVGARDISFLDVQVAVEAVNDARTRLAETRRELWRAVADLQGLMQLDLE